MSRDPCERNYCSSPLISDSRDRGVWQRWENRKRKKRSCPGYCRVLTNISWYCTEKHLYWSIHKTATICYFLFSPSEIEKSTPLTTKSTIKMMCMKNLIQEHVIFLWITNTPSVDSNFQKLLSKIKFLHKGFCQSYRQ